MRNFYQVSAGFFSGKSGKQVTNSRKAVFATGKVPAGFLFGKSGKRESGDKRKKGCV